MLKEGDKAPNFSLESDAGNVVRLSDFRGKRLVLYFYPKDSTPGCTREAQGFSALLPRFVEAGVAVVGVSKDSVKSHCSFRDKFGLKLPLLSDPELEVHRLYGAFGKKLMYGRQVEGTIRSTFVIGEDGRVERVYPSVKVDGHPEAVLAFVSGERDGETRTPSPRPAAKKVVTRARESTARGSTARGSTARGSTAARGRKTK